MYMYIQMLHMETVQNIQVQLNLVHLGSVVREWSRILLDEHYVEHCVSIIVPGVDVYTMAHQTLHDVRVALNGRNV